MANHKYEKQSANDELIEEIESCAWSAMTDVMMGRSSRPSGCRRVGYLTPALFAALKLMRSGLPDRFQATVTYDQLAEEAGVSRRTAIKHIGALVEMEMIQKWSNHYGVTLQPGARIGGYLVTSYEGSVDG